MNALKSQDPVKETGAIKSRPNQGNITYDSGLRALLSIRDFDFILEQHYAHIMRIENRTEAMSKNILTEFEGYCTPESLLKLKDALNEISFSVLALTKILNVIKEKIAEKNRADTSEIWSRFDTLLEQLKTAFMQLKHLGTEILAENLHASWASNIAQFEGSLLPLIVSYARSCRVELQMIERYTIVEMNAITQIIVSKIPKDFNVAEAEEYEADYLMALKDFKQEFSEEKNLWDKFLDILAGGTHQSPSEHVMMERWIEGEKRDL